MVEYLGENAPLTAVGYRAVHDAPTTDVTPSTPLPVTNSGNSAVTVADGADVAQGTTTDPAYTGGASGTVISILKGIWTRLRGGQQTSANSLPVVVASDQSAVPVQGSTGGTPLPIASVLSAQTTLQNAAGATGNGTSMAVAGYASALLTVSITNTATVTFEGSEDSTNGTNGTWNGLDAGQSGTVGVGPTAAASGLYSLNCAGLSYVRARISSWTSGTVTVTGHATTIAWAPRQVNALLAQLISGEDQTNLLLAIANKLPLAAGYSPLASTSFGTATKANAKATPGLAIAIACSNANAAVRYLQLHNKASAPVGTDVPLFCWPIPAGTANAPGTAFVDFTFFGPNAYYLDAGVAWAISTTAATFTDAATAGDHILNMTYR